MKQYLFNIRHLCVLLVLAAVTCSCASCKHTPTREELRDEFNRKQKRAIDGDKLTQMLHNKNYEAALLFIDTMHVLYPRDPQFYFCEAWVYQMKNDSAKATSCYMKARSIYDKLIEEKDDLGDKINHAAITQILYGKEEYDKELDIIVKSVDNQRDSIYVEAYKQLILGKKEIREMFDGESSFTPSKNPYE